MNIPHVAEVKEIVGDTRLAILREIFQFSTDFPPGVQADRFRADHVECLDQLDGLVGSEILLKNNYQTGRYRVTAYALPLLGSKHAEKCLVYMEKAYIFLRRHYSKSLREPIEGKLIVKELGLKSSVGLQALFYMRDVDGWWSSVGNDFPIGESQFVIVNENVLRYDTLGKLLARVYEWHYINPKEQANNPPLPLGRSEKGTTQLLRSSKEAKGKGWVDGLDDVKRALIREIDSAIQNDLRALPTIGIRTLIEIVMIDFVGDQGTFARTLEKFWEAGYVTRQHADLIDGVLDAGHASAHRAHFPNAEDIGTCVQVVKHLMEGVYVIRPNVDRLAGNTPPRSKRKSPAP